MNKIDWTSVLIVLFTVLTFGGAFALCFGSNRVMTIGLVSLLTGIVGMVFATARDC